MDATPNLLVEESEKTHKWIENIAQHIRKNRHSNTKSEDTLLWGYYHNSFQASRFNYFLEFGNNRLPAKARHIPLQRHLIDILVSEMTLRERDFTVSTIDKESVDQKQEAMTMAMINDMMEATRSAKVVLNTQLSGIDQQAQSLQQMLQTQPENEEQAKQIDQLRMQMPAILARIDMIREGVSTEKDIVDKKARDLERYYRMDWKDIKEDIASNLIQALYQRLRIKNEEKKAFISNCVTGKHSYLVDYFEDERLPTFKCIDSMKIYFPKIDGIEWVQDGPWVMIYEPMTFQQLSIEFGSDIKKKYGKEKLKELQDVYPTDTNKFVATPEGGVVYDKYPYSGSDTSEPAVDVFRIFFKAPRIERVKFSPNPHQVNKYFKHFINPHAKIVNEDEYIYSSARKEFVSKDNPDDIIRKADAETYSLKKGQYIEEYYTNDIFEAVIIDKDIVVQTRKKRFTPRSVDRHSDVKLPIFSKSFSSYTDKPYSLVFNTKDIQELYDVVYTHQELMLALAGTKTIIFDRSQKPRDMDDSLWNYQLKLGRLNIQTTDPNGNPIRTNFNQWQALDLSLSNSIQYLENIKDRLEENMGNIIGIPRQRLAQVKDSDQVGTFKQSIRQSYLITEILFNGHEEVLEKALSYLVAIAGRYTHRNGGTIEVNKRGFGRQMITIPKDLLKSVDMDVIIENSGRDKFKMEELKELAGINYKDGRLPFRDLVEVFDSNTLKELKSKVDYFSQKAEEMQQKMRQEDFQNQKALQQEAIQFQQEFDGYWKQKEYEIQQFKTKFEQKESEFRSMLDKERLDLDKLQLNVDSQLKYMELLNEKESEDNVIIANMSAQEANNKLKALEIQLNYLMNTAQVIINKDANEKKHTEQMKKITEDSKAKKMVKEHASDR